MNRCTIAVITILTSWHAWTADTGNTRNTHTYGQYIFPISYIANAMQSNHTHQPRHYVSPILPLAPWYARMYPKTLIYAQQGYYTIRSITLVNIDHISRILNASDRFIHEELLVDDDSLDEAKETPQSTHDPGTQSPNRDMYQLKQKRPQCPMCLDPLRSGEHHRLSCGHGLCYDCWPQFADYNQRAFPTLTRMRLLQPQYPCPLCRAIVPVNNYS